MSLQATGKVSNTVLKGANDLAGIFGISEESAINLITNNRDKINALTSIWFALLDTLKVKSNRVSGDFIKKHRNNMTAVIKAQKYGLLSDNFNASSLELERLVNHYEKNINKNNRKSIFGFGFTQNGQTANLA